MTTHTQFKHSLQKYAYVAAAANADTATDSSDAPMSTTRLLRSRSAGQPHSSLLEVPPSATSPLPEPESVPPPVSSPRKTTKRPSLSTSSAPPAKKRKATSKYAPPSKYQHLSPLTDILAPNLISVFIGTNPGIRTASQGHAYAHPSNSFWKLLHSSGCTDERLRPDQDVQLPQLYLLGNTNIVERPTKDAAELSKAEMVAGTPPLEEKCRKWRPESVCVVGKGIWEAIYRHRHGQNPTKAQFKWGWQDEEENMGRIAQVGEDGYQGARVFVTTSTSGLSASLKPAEKEAIWKPFGEWCKQRRIERAWPPPKHQQEKKDPQDA